MISLYRVLLFSAFAFFPSIVHAAEWFEDDVGATGYVYSESFSSGSGFISGASGFAAKTSDYGKTWTDISTGTSSLRGIVYFGGDAYAVGETGLLKKYTSSSGWSTLSSGTTSTLYDIAAYSSSIYAVGVSGTIIRSTDSGSSFSALTPITSYTLNAISQSGAEFWAVGNNGTVLRKSASSSTFSSVSSGTSVTLNDVDVYYKTGSPTVWIAGGNGVLKKSTDGGTSWETITIPGIGVSNIYDIDFTGDYGVATIGGDVYFTDDGGDTWEEMDYGDAVMSPLIYDVSLTNTGSGLFIRAASYSGFFIYESSTPTAASGLTVSGGSPTTDTTPAISWTAGSDSHSTITYSVSLDGATTDYGPFTTSSTSYTFSALSDDAYTLSVTATDESGNSSSATTSLTVDTAVPTVTPMLATEGTVGEDFSLYAMTGDTSGVTSCVAYVEGESDSYTLTYSPALIMWYGTYTPTAAGDLEIMIVCEDALGHTGEARRDVTFSAADTGDTTAPTVTIVSPTEWVERYTSTYVIATVTDNVGVSRCDLYLNSYLWDEMIVSGESATVSTAFEDSSAPIYVQCADTSGNVGVSSVVTLEVLSESEAIAREASEDAEDSAVEEEEDSDDASDTETNTQDDSTEEESSASETEEVSDEDAQAGTLIKMACDETQAVEVNDPCKAVYFYGSDEKRHAFPNEKVYFTWYEDFDDVVIVSDEFMASLQLGRNVTYHPAKRMVKFITVNTVYVVTRGGELRAVVSEEVASDLYGSEWNTWIDDISDAFFGNYTFGDDVEDADDFNRDEEEDSVEDIDDNL